MIAHRQLPLVRCVVCQFIFRAAWSLLLVAFCGCSSEQATPPAPSIVVPARTESSSTSVETPPPGEDLPSVDPSAESPDAGSDPAGHDLAWISLFDGQQLGGWRPSGFATQGEVTLRDGAIHIQGGDMCSGITWDKAEDLPRLDYELQLQAKRVEGTDFFCGLTFPVNEECCSFIVGGWGGGTVGLSCLDGYDASDNETSSWYDFVQDQWYTIRVVVRADHISAWIDEEHIVDVDLEGREVSIRPEVYESQPLGIATWQTSALIRRIQFRKLPPPETKGE